MQPWKDKLFVTAVMEETEAIPISDANLELQARFIAIIAEMKASDCPLPDSFELFFRVRLQHDRGGRAISIRPFLCESAAWIDTDVNRKWEGAYGSNVCYDVLDSRNRAKTENYSTSSKDRSLHELDVKICD